jgi:hypothetical protein
MPTPSDRAFNVQAAAQTMLTCMHQPNAVPCLLQSAAAQVKTVGGSAEYSLAECLSPASKGTSSPHSSPPVSKGSADDAEVHPSKAYIPDPQVPPGSCNSSTSPFCAHVSNIMRRLHQARTATSCYLAACPAPRRHVGSTMYPIAPTCSHSAQHANPSLRTRHQLACAALATSRSVNEMLPPAVLAVSCRRSPARKAWNWAVLAA